MMKTVQNNYLLKKRLEVLNFAKASVLEEGLNHNSLKKISKKYDLDINEIDLLFPEGNIDLIQFSIQNK